MAFPEDFPVFVSSDERSIPGGEGWWQHIRDSIKEREVVLVLLSDESVSREWINFEAGVGDGTGAKVLPVAIKSYRFDKLDFPLKGFQGRYVRDLEGILYDISLGSKWVAGEVDKAAYLNAIERAGVSLVYKSLVFQPVRTTFIGSPHLMFEIENRGNVDIDLLFAEVRVPQLILAPRQNISEAPPTLEIDAPSDNWLVRYYSAPNTVRPGVRRLEPTITRSMGVRRLKELRFGLKPDLTEEDLEVVIRYQIHGRDYDTQPEEMRLRDIRVACEKCS